MGKFKNKQRFLGHRDVSGVCHVSYNAQELDPRLDLFYHSRDGFDWGYMGAGALQLAFAMLMLFSNEKNARYYKTLFAKEVIAKLPNKEWSLDAQEILEWLYQHGGEESIITEGFVRKDENIVKSICRELGITQKRLAEILEVPEGTVSSWAVKNDIPRLGKKAIEFYMENRKNEAIVGRFKELIKLVEEA